MVDREMGSVDCNANGGKFSGIPWSFEANWIITHGSLESSIAVESSEDLIAEPDHENTASNSPLILKPRGSDSAPCEIKICFKQKYKVGQIYVRSTARAYEIYYATTPHSINEYLSTVWCGVAARDDIILQTSSVEDVAEEHGECLSGYITAKTASNGVSTATSEDDWVKIKVSGDGSSPASDTAGTNGLNFTQDLYEATAEISDSDPCLSLTIRFLSLEDKGQVYVDEIYVFVDPVESADSGNEAELAGTSAQSSLLAMFVPTLLQLSKSGINQAPHKSDEVLKNHKMESESTTVDKIDSPQQSAKPEETCKDTTETVEHQQHTSSNKCVEEKSTTGIQPSRLESAMEQLVSRLSRVEDICLRFEEKILKPIERIESRLQQVENQLQKLAKNSPDVGLPRGTRISAPDFSCTESNSGSFYNDDLEMKDFACDNMRDLSLDLEANSNPGLIMSAPEFSYGEGDNDNDDLKPLEDSPRVEPKKTLSVDDAWAAALNGFMSTAVNSSKPIKIPTHLLGDIDEETQYQGHSKSCQIETREFPAAVNDNTELSQYAQGGLTVKAPDFTVEDTVTEEQLNSVQSSLDVAFATENKRKDEIIPPGIASTDSCVNKESSAHVRILTVKAVEDTVSEEQLNSVQSSLDVAYLTGKERRDEIVPPSIASADSYDNTESSSAHARNLTVKASDFIVEDTVSEEQLNSVQSLQASLDVASLMEKEKRGEIVPPSIASADLYDNTESSSAHAHARNLAVKAPDFTVEDTVSEEQLNYVQSSLDVASVTENERKDEIVPPSIASADLCDNTESAAHAQILTVKAPDFTVEDTVSEVQLNSQSSLDVAAVTENERMEAIPPCSTDSADSCKFGRDEGVDEFGSASNGDFPAVNGVLNGSSKVNMIETYFQGDITGSPAEITKDSVPNSAKDLTACVHQTFHEKNQGKLHEAEIVAKFVKQNIAKESFEDDAGCLSEPSHVAFADLEFPILEVKFRSDELMSPLLDYEAVQFTSEVSSNDPNGINDVNAKEVEEDVCSNDDEAADRPLPNGLLLDRGTSAANLRVHPKARMIHQFKKKWL